MGVSSERPSPLTGPSASDRPRTRLVAEVGDRTLGPLLVSPPSPPVLVYVGVADDRVRRLYSGATRPGEESEGRPLAVVPAEATPFVARASSARADATVLAAWVAPSERAFALSLAAVGADGRLKTAPIEVSRPQDPVPWVDIVPAGKGALCVWAEELGDGSASLLAMPVTEDGKPRGVPSRIVSRAVAWDIVATGEGPVLAVALESSVDGRHTRELRVQRLDEAGRLRGEVLGSLPNVAAGSDLKLEKVDGGVAVAWTDRSGIEPHVRVALPKPEGTKVFTPFESAGSSALVAMTAGPGGLVVAWDEPLQRRLPQRPLHLAVVDVAAAGAVRSSIALEVQGHAPVELRPWGDGFALSATVPTCGRGDPCVPVFGPAVVQLDGQLVARAAFDLTTDTTPRGRRGLLGVKMAQQLSLRARA